MASTAYHRSLTTTVVLGVITSISISGVAAPSDAAATGADRQDSARPGDATMRAEAASRFDRALKLFEAGDNAGALAEFKRIDEIMPDPLVRYNMGLVYAAMGRPVDAVDALEPLIERGELATNHLERAKQTLLDQKARIGRLVVTTHPAVARIEIDSVEVARAPLTAPIRISEGKHVVGAVAEGFAPARKELFIAGNADVTMTLELVPTQGKQVASIAVVGRPTAAEVWVDGKLVGRTPLSTSVTVPPGHHLVELKRPGYVSERRELDLSEGAAGELAFNLAVDSQALERDGATLVLDASESPIEVTVDGTRQGLYSGPLRLPRGPHHISVAAVGFVPLESDVTLDGAHPNVVRMQLEPTFETRKNYRSNALLHRTWGWIGLVGGVVVTGASGVLVGIGTDKRGDAQDRLDAINLNYDKSKPPCDWRQGYAAENSLPDLCNKTRSDARNDISAANTLRTAGFVGVGVGSAIAVTGLVLLLTGNDPNKYERVATTKTGRVAGPQTALLPGPGELGLGMRLEF